MCQCLTSEQFGFVLALFYHHQLAPSGFTDDWPLSFRFTPHAALRWDQRGQVVRRPSPLATACHRPPNCQKPYGPDLDERVVYSSMSPNQTILRTK